MRGNLTFPLFLTQAGLYHSGLGALVAGFGEEPGEHRRDKIDQGVGEEKEEEGHCEKAKDKASGIQGGRRHASEFRDWDLNLLKNRVDRDMKFLSQEVAKAFLEKPDRELGDRVGDPAGGGSDGDIGAKSHRSDGSEDHLSDDGEH